MKKGYQLTFFTQQDRRHHHKPLADWLVSVAKDLGIGGATVLAASEGYGHDLRIHSARFFELADQPQAVMMVVAEDECRRLFDLLEGEPIRVFCVKVPVEFGELGAGGASWS